MEPREIHSGFRHQRRELGNKIQRFEDNVGGTIMVRGFQFVAHPQETVFQAAALKEVIKFPLDVRGKVLFLFL